MSRLVLVMSWNIHHFRFGAVLDKSMHYYTTLVPHGTLYIMFGINVEQLIASGGIILVAAIVFAESGLLLGFFLPGDTLLISAGFLAAQNKLSIIWLVIAVIVAAIAGDNVGYFIGKKAGKKLFTKKDSVIFDPEHIKKAEEFYEKHGGKTIIMARFIPIIRTFAPMVAGIGGMSRKSFSLFNAVGGTLWGGGVTLIGYYAGKKLGHLINIDKYLLPFLGAITLFTLVPTLYHIFKEPKTRKALKNWLKSKLKK